MNSTNVFTTEGTGMPRKWPNQTTSGSIDAATIDVASIFRGVVGMIIDDTRMTTVFHDNCPRPSPIGVCTQLFRRATPTAFTTKYRRPASAFDSGRCGAYRT